ERAGEQRDRRRGHHVDGVTIAARREDAGHQGGLEQRPGAARVAADHQAHALHAALGLERGHELPPDTIDQLGGEWRLVGDPADTVGAEHRCHFADSSVWRAADPTAWMFTVTCTLPSFTAETASGSASSTLRVTRLRCPVTSTGAVGTVSRASIV